MTQLAGPACVWIGPEPKDGSHSNVVGDLVIDELGVHVPKGASYSLFDEGEWSPLGCYFFSTVDNLLPWHRVHGVDWVDEDYLERSVNLIKERRTSL